MSGTVELDLEDVAAVVVHLIHLERVELEAGRFDLAQRCHNIAEKLAVASGKWAIRGYVADHKAAHAGLYPARLEGVGA